MIIYTDDITWTSQVFEGLWSGDLIDVWSKNVPGPPEPTPLTNYFAKKTANYVQYLYLFLSSIQVHSTMEYSDDVYIVVHIFFVQLMRRR